MGLPGNTIRSALLGVPLNPSKQPDRAGVVRAVEQLDARVIANSSGAIIKNSLANLNAHVSPASSLMAWVMASADAGVYENAGSPSSPSWVKRGPLPYSVIRFLNLGAGTADAIVATSWITPPDDAGLALFTLEILEANTDAVTINGKALKLGNGSPVPAGYLQPGEILFLDHGEEYRLLYFGDPAAVQSAVEAALASFLALYLGAYADDAAATTAAGTPVEGQKYWNSTDNLMKVWNGSAWVASEQVAATITSDGATGDGATTDYTLPESAETGNTHIYIDGRRITSGYTLSTGALSLSEAPASGVPIDWDVFEVVAMGQTTAAQVTVSNPDGDMDGASNVQEMFDYLRVNIIGGASAQIARPEDYDGVGNGTANDTAAVLAAMQSGKPDLVLRGTYLTDLQTWSAAVCPDLRRIFAERRGTLKQRAQNQNMLLVYQVDRPYIEGLKLQGIWDADLTDQSNIDNRGIILQETTRAKIVDLYATRMKFHPIHVLGGSDIEIDGLEAFECGSAFYCRGSTGANSLRRVKANQSIFDDSKFTIAVSFESTDGHSYGVPDGWSVDTVRVQNFLNAQAVMAHSGTNMRFRALDIDGSVIGFSLNSAGAALGADTLARITLSDSVINLPGTGPAGYSGGNSCVYVAGDAANGTYATQIGVSNVQCANGNRAEQAATQGAVQVQDSKDFQMIGGGIVSPYGGGIVFNGSNDDFAVNGPTIRSVIDVSGNRNGVWVRNTGNTGHIGGLTIRDAGTGVRREAGNDVSIGTNKYSSVSTETV